MGRENRLGKIENWIIAVGAVAVLGVFAALRFDYYYDLNDDVLMKDILPEFTPERRRGIIYRCSGL